MQILRKSDSNLKMLFVKESDTDIKDYTYKTNVYSAVVDL